MASNSATEKRAAFDGMVEKLVKLTSTPSKLFKYFFRYIPGVSLGWRVKFDAIQRAPYAYGIYKAALQAKSLNIPRITAIEFGVAGGNGLLAMEHIADEIERELGVTVSIYGFDIVEGLPMPRDYRDLPYAWSEGSYKMDESSLRARLRRSTLILGDVRDTVPEFFDKNHSPPIGFISFDLDYYSSTKEALRIFEHQTQQYLPRVLCYFDDTLGHDDEYHFDEVGELLAIKEFNARHEQVKLGKINGLRYKRCIPDQWNEGFFVCHFFNNPLYNTHVSRIPKELPLV